MDWERSRFDHPQLVGGLWVVTPDKTSGSLWHALTQASNVFARTPHQRY